MIAKSALAVGCLVIVFIAQVSSQENPPRPSKKASTLSERLSTVKNVGMKGDENNSSFTLVVYDEDQHAKHVELLSKYHEEWKDNPKRVEKLAAQRVEALNEGNPQLAALLREEELRTPKYPFEDGLTLYDVVHVGSDYVELRRLDSPNGIVLILKQA